MSEFKTYHPIVNFAYFVAVIGFSMFFMHPVCLAISIMCSFAYSVMLNGRKTVRFMLFYMLPLLIASAAMNTAFNHEGVTILTYLPGGNPITIESIFYGLAAASMLVSVICWFSCFNKIMTSDKFIYLFGKITPSLSLILSMTLRFVPKFKSQIKIVSNAQKCVGKDIANGSIVKRAKNGLKILSIMITWSLENAVETSDSMKSRGYGLACRTAFSNYCFDKRDAKALICTLLLAVYTLAGKFLGKIYFNYFPSIKSMSVSAYGISVFLAYFMLCTLPIIIELREAWRWKLLKSKI